MCGIAAIITLGRTCLPDLSRRLQVMNRLQSHRGPDGEDLWCRPCHSLGLGHRRLALVDLRGGSQPMSDEAGNRLTSNAEIYNHQELRQLLPDESWRGSGDTETLLAAYRRWGEGFLEKLRGMFSFALWDERKQSLFCARDRLGIKPFYYTVVNEVLYCSSEAKALLPFLPAVETDREALEEYRTFQFCLQGKTLFRNIWELPPGHTLQVRNGCVRVSSYWHPPLPASSGPRDRSEELRQVFDESVSLSLRGDVSVGAFVSGGLDSSLIAERASRSLKEPLLAFHGRFDLGASYDESPYARALAEALGLQLHTITIRPEDLVNNLPRVIYHLDFPVAGPGSFSQFMVARTASQFRRAALCGQGGDELFAGYARYRLVATQTAVPGYQELSARLEGLTDLEDRYFAVLQRRRRSEAQTSRVYQLFRELFQRARVSDCPFDTMARFDLETFLPALLQVEDRMSMAHGLESRVPLLDHRLVEQVLALPPQARYGAGQPKALLKQALSGRLPREIEQRTDKMGFPTPLVPWLQNEAADFFRDVMGSARPTSELRQEQPFARSAWGALCLALWQREFHDRARYFRKMLTEPAA